MRDQHTQIAVDRLYRTGINTPVYRAGRPQFIVMAGTYPGVEGKITENLEEDNILLILAHLNKVRVYKLTPQTHNNILNALSTVCTQ